MKVLFVAEDMKATLLTGDQKLRSCAEGRGITVSGIFWAFDEMLKKKKLTSQTGEPLASGGRV